MGFSVDPMGNPCRRDFSTPFSVDACTNKAALRVVAIKKQDLSIDTNFEQFCENWIDPILVWFHRRFDFYLWIVFEIFYFVFFILSNHCILHFSFIIFLSFFSFPCLWVWNVFCVFWFYFKNIYHKLSLFCFSGRQFKEFENFWFFYVWRRCRCVFLYKFFLSLFFFFIFSFVFFFCCGQLWRESVINIFFGFFLVFSLFFEFDFILWIFIFQFLFLYFCKVFLCEVFVSSFSLFSIFWYFDLVECSKFSFKIFICVFPSFLFF